VVLKRDSEKVYKLFVSKVQQQQWRQHSPSDWPSCVEMIPLFSVPHMAMLIAVNLADEAEHCLII